MKRVDKLCGKCKTLKPASEFHRAKASKDGLQHWCKLCRKAYSSTPEERARDRRRAEARRLGLKPIIPDGLKRCGRCRNVKPLAEFWNSIRMKSGKQGSCKACLRDYAARPEARHRRRLRTNSLTMKLYMRRIAIERRQDPQRYAQMRAVHRAYYYANKTQLMEQMKAYRRRHPEHARVSKHRRRAREANVAASFTSADWRRCVDYWNARCAVCGTPETLFATLAADHWIPLADRSCPGTVPWNIVPLCHSKPGGIDCCNQTKGHLDPVEWLNRRLGPDAVARKLAEINAYFDSVKPTIVAQ